MNEAATAVAGPAAVTGGRWGRGRLIQVALLGATIGLLVAFRDRLPDFGVMWRAASGARPGWVVVVVVASALSMGAFARLQRRLLLGGGVRMSLRRAFAVTYAGNALSTTLPAGPAVSVLFSYKQFRRSGASAQLATAVIVVGGVITSTAYGLVALVALLAEPQFRWPAGGALVATAAPAAALVLAWRRAGARARMIALARRAGGALLRQRRLAPYAGHLLQSRNVLRLTRGDVSALAAFAVLNWLFDILALVAATRAVGIEVAPYGVALAYFGAQAAGSLLPLLPGGLGAIESSMAAALVAMGAHLGPAGAAVGLYRLVSYWAVVLVGWFAWVLLRESRLPGATRRRLAAVGRALGDSLAVGAGAFPYGYPVRPPMQMGAFAVRAAAEGHGTR